MTLSDRYNSIRKHTEHLCNALTTEDFVPQPADFVSPPKWHLAHTTWFFEQFVLNEHLPDYKLFDDDFSFLFNSYYNFVGNRVFRADRGNITRPGVHEVFEYRSYVDMHMQILLQLKSEELKDLIELGLNHEQQHQELLITDIKYILGNNPIFPVYDENIDWEKQENEETGFVKLEEGIYEIGFEGEGFSFDNEHGRHKVYLHDFEISKSLVTNAEYLEFISNGGYKNFDYWLDEGWSWVTENKIEAPLYWHKIDGEWHNYTLGGLEKLNPEAILTHISFYEAVAFAAWKKCDCQPNSNGKLLPTNSIGESVGNGQIALTCPIRILKNPKALSENITENSWSIRWYSVALPVPRRHSMTEKHTETFSCP